MPDLDVTKVVTTDYQNILQLEKDVIAKLNTYYSCVVKSGNTESGSYLQPNECISDFNKVNTAINVLKSALATQLTPIDTKNTTNTTINTTKEDHEKILKLRNELDIKLKEINRSQDSVYSMYKAKYDSTMYSSIIWTILATSLIYYIFVKL
jgi:hypothetical protein